MLQSDWTAIPVAAEQIVVYGLATAVVGPRPTKHEHNNNLDHVGRQFFVPR